MIVLKFGGTSIQDESGIRRMLGIVRKSEKRGPVLVFSAMGKTTRNLLRLGTYCAEGIMNQADILFREISGYHREVANQMLRDPVSVEEALYPWFDGIQDCMNRILKTHALEPVMQDRLLAYGELMASTIMNAVLQSNQMEAYWLDAREFIVTNERFTRAVPAFSDTEKAVRESVLPIVRQGNVPVTQGYIGASGGGNTTTLGFEGSDLTAALLGASLEADEIQIWKDVPGILTADPEVVAEAFTVNHLSFEEASVLTACGAKVLHPGTIRPAREKGIPVSIFSTHQPDGPHTLIENNGKPTVKSIAYKTGLRLIRMKSFGSGPDFRDRIKSILGPDCQPRLWIQDLEGIQLVVEEAILPKEWDSLLTGLTSFESVSGVASVSVVGEKLRHQKGKRDFFRQILKDIPLLADAENDTLAWTGVLEEKHMETALVRLHNRLFSETNR